MFSTRTRTGRAAFATIALASAVGMSACQSDTSVKDAPSASAPTASASQSAAASESSAPESSAPETSTSEAPSSESSSSTSESSSSSSTSAASSEDATLTPKGTKLKFGQQAVVKEGSGASADTYKLTAKSLDVAPDSLYSSEPSLKKANGKVYFLRYSVTNVGKSGSSFDAGSVNGFMFTPRLASGQSGKKFSGDVAGCKTDDKNLAVGESGEGCMIYQAGGATITDAVFAPGLTLQVSWSK